MKKYDVVTAGAGPAGCLAARDLAGAGATVALIEKRAAEATGHDWWDSIEASIFDEIGLPPSQPPELMKGFDFTLLLPGGGEVEHVSMTSEHVNVDRKLFDRRLLDAAIAAGAELIDRAEVTGPVIGNGFVTGVEIIRNGGRTEKIGSEICIDATGAAAAVRSKMPRGHGFAPRLKRGDCVATWREIREDTTRGAGRSILVIGGGQGAKWVSRNQPGLVEFFACVMNRPGAASPKELVAELVRTEGGAGAEVLRGGYGALIPVRRAFDSFVAPGFILAGDSACMANPINGSGITSGLRGAKFAARAAARALGAGCFDVASLWRCNSDYKRTQDALFAPLYMLQRFLLAEREDNISMLFNSDLIDTSNFWSPEHQTAAGADIKNLPRLAPLLSRPLFLARLTLLFTLIGMLGDHYRNYPEEYNPRAFNSWRLRTRFLFSLVPG